jgi:membrane-associated protease RseP (regulator of RpoE activity)
MLKRLRLPAIVLAAGCLALGAHPAAAVDPADPADPAKDFYSGPPRLGVVVQPMTPELRVWLSAPPGVGVLVSRVEPGGPAAEAGIEVGDVIIEADGQEVHSRSDLAWETVRTEEDEAVHLVLVRRGQRVELDVVPKGNLRRPDWTREKFWAPLQAPFVRELREGLQELEKRLEKLEKDLEEGEAESEERT